MPWRDLWERLHPQRRKHCPLSLSNSLACLLAFRSCLLACLPACLRACVRPCLLACFPFVCWADWRCFRPWTARFGLESERERERYNSCVASRLSMHGPLLLPSAAVPQARTEPLLTGDVLLFCRVSESKSSRTQLLPCSSESGQLQRTTKRDEAKLDILSPCETEESL